MKDEILAPKLPDDVEAIPRYNIVGPDGSVLYSNVEIVLQNDIIQEGTMYNKESVLSDEVAELYGLSEDATPNSVFRAIAVNVYADIEEMSKQIAENTAKINTLWDAVFTNITGNPFNIVFSSLSGITVTAGVYNQAQSRLEC